MFHITVKWWPLKNCTFCWRSLQLASLQVFKILKFAFWGFFTRGQGLGCTADTLLNSLHVCSCAQKGSNSILSHYRKTGLNFFVQFFNNFRK